MTLKYCEIQISPPEDPLMGAPVVHRVAVPLVNLANVIPLIEKSGLRVTAIVQFEVMTPEEFVEANKFNNVLGALMKKPVFSNEGETE